MLLAELKAESEGKNRAIVRLAVAVVAMGMGIVLYAAAKLAGKFWRVT
jgi:hypothetical protein